MNFSERIYVKQFVCRYFWPASKMDGEWMYKKKIREICPNYRKRSAFHAVFVFQKFRNTQLRLTRFFTHQNFPFAF